MSTTTKSSIDMDWPDLLVKGESHSAPGADPSFTLGITLLDDAGVTVVTIPIKTVHGWPEVKTAMEVQCVKVAGVKVCTKVPVVYHRESDLAIVATISFPSLNDITQQVRDCVIVSATATVIASAVSFQWEAASAELLGLLKACLIAKGVQDVSKVAVGVHGDITPGPWH